MKRLNLLLVIILLLSTHNSYAQAYTLLHADATGDETQDVQDISKVSYRINTAKDSIWFKIETNTQMSPSSQIGFMLGLDTNLVGTTGKTWAGTNTSMKYDHALFIYQNGMMEPGVVHTDIGDVSTALPCSVSIQKPDTKTLIIGMKMSVLDPNGDFNMIMGSGFSDIALSGTTYDDAPETTVMQIRKPTTGINVAMVKETFAVYPNPAKDIVRWNYESKDNAQLFDVTGKVLTTVPVDSKQIDMSTYQPGIYMLKIGAATSNIVKE